ncbi:MAG: hypothetical protein J6S00_07840 [Clostridia bacterium]|nr:hypothetical protein [Clostridia bacterium]
MDALINKAVNNNEDNFSIDFEIERTPVRLGKSGRVFYMDFNDTNFPVRLQEGREEIAKFFESKSTELGISNFDEIKTNNLENEDIQKIIATTKEIDDFIKSKIDYIFGYEVSKDVFGTASSVSVTKNGEYYFDNFLNALLPLIEREYQVRIKATNERVRKYTDRKGTHPALKK